MIVTDCAAWAERAKYLTTQAKDDPIEYRHGEIGYNYRMNNIQAAMGCAQLEQLGDYVAAKRRIAAGYTDALTDVPGLTPMSQAPWAFSTFWMYSVLVDEAQYGMDSRTLLHELDRVGVQSRPLWQPLHQSPAHTGAPTVGGNVAEGIYQKGLSLPCSVGLGERQASVLQALRTNQCT